MIGVATLIYVLFGPPKTAGDKLMEKALEDGYRSVMDASKAEQ